jgi:hypothetical protein
MLDDIQINIAGGLDILLPKMVKVRQQFEQHRIEDVGAAISTELARPEIASCIKPGATIAIGVGSRGVANIGTAVEALVNGIKSYGAEPFIFPAMGSHAGATAAGQTELLANYGITEARIGAPVRATMETVIVTEMADGTPLHMDRYAYEADGVILINRVKPHTTFRGDIESGVVKMMIIGMGKISGASILHSEHGMDRFPDTLPLAAETLMRHIPFLFGIALVEDAYDHTAIVEAIPASQLITREKALLVRAKALMARLYFDDIDVLVIERMGKEISGAGFDPNITGRNSRGVVGFDTLRVEKIVVLDLSNQTHGNATGIGLADVITQRLLKRIDFAVTYSNVITSAYLDGALLPIPMKTEQDAIRLAIKTAPRVKPKDVRLVRIRDTLTLSEIEVSVALLEEVRVHSQMEILAEPAEMVFTAVSNDNDA